MVCYPTDLSPESIAIRDRIHADAMASHQSVVQLMEAARIAGLPKLVFAAQSGAAR